MGDPWIKLREETHMSKTRLQVWFEEVKGLRVEEPETGEIFQICDVRENPTIFIGLVSEGGTLKYVTLERFDEFISIG